MAAPRRRRRNQNRFLDNIGRISPSTMAMFGIAILLLIASVGIVGLTVVRRSSATTADNMPTAEPTPFVAIVETAVPTPDIGTPTTTPRLSPTSRTSATPQRTSTARTTPTVAAGALGSGQSKGARGVAGSMAIALGGTLPPAQTASSSTQPTVPAVIPSIPTPTQGIPTATRTPVPSSGGGNSGGGNTGGGNTGGGSNPTPTRTRTATATIPPTATRPPTATATATPIPTLPAVAYPGPGSKTHSFNLNYVQTANLANAPTSAQSYTITWDSITKVRVEQIKNALGLTAEVVATGDGFKVNDAKGDLVANNTSGLIRFTTKGVASAPQVAARAETPTITPTAGGFQPISVITPTVSPSAAPSVAPSAAPSPSPSAAPSASPSAAPSVGPTQTVPPTKVPTPGPQIDPAKAIELARGWLGQATMLPGGIDAGRATRPNPDQYIVVFHPSDPGSLLVSDPAITVTVGTDGTVREVNYHWPNTLTPHTTEAISAQSAWENALAEMGYLEVDLTVPANTNTIFTGTATVTKVSVGWGLATDKGINYLVPLFVFEGKVALDNPPQGQDKTRDFRIYVQASP